METRTLETEIFGRKIEFDYSENRVGYSLLLMRLSIGWIMFQGGLTKIMDPTWTAAGYLNNIPAGNPFGFWSMMAGVPMVDMLVTWGLLLTGLGLIFGALFRWSAFWASVMNLMFWASSLEGGLMQGLPIAHGWVIDSHIVYIMLLFGLAAFGAGRILGVDQYLEQYDFVQEHDWLNYLLG